jgi:hypothetical protein
VGDRLKEVSLFRMKDPPTTPVFFVSMLTKKIIYFDGTSNGIHRLIKNYKNTTFRREADFFPPFLPEDDVDCDNDH